MVRLFCTAFVGKTVLFLTKKFSKGTGTAAPGYYGLKFSPNFIKQISKFLPDSIIITGTNGKTTTAQLLSHFAKQSNIQFLRNKKGSNLERGIVSALIEQIPLLYFLSPQKIKDKFAICIWEIDEAAFAQVAPKIKPKKVLFLNLFRDQLDRYGEINNILNKWCNTIQGLDENSKVFINYDDANLHKLQDCIKTPIRSFSVKGEKIKGEKETINLKTKPQLFAQNIKQDGMNGSSFELCINNKIIKIQFPLPGLYNVYNFLAAVILADSLGIDLNVLQNLLKNFSPAFGRVERIDWQGKIIYIFLIKNPMGATEVIKLLSQNLNPNDKLMLALNDNLADGTDVSWIWDAEFEKLESFNLNIPILISGTRAFDLGLRLKYAGINEKLLQINNNLRQSLEHALAGDAKRLFIIPTYTALLELQKILVKKNIKTE